MSDLVNAFKNEWQLAISMSGQNTDAELEVATSKLVQATLAGSAEKLRQCIARALTLQAQEFKLSQDQEGRLSIEWPDPASILERVMAEVAN